MANKFWSKAAAQAGGLADLRHAEELDPDAFKPKMVRCPTWTQEQIQRQLRAIALAKRIPAEVRVTNVEEAF